MTATVRQRLKVLKAVGGGNRIIDIFLAQTRWTHMIVFQGSVVDVSKTDGSDLLPERPIIDLKVDPKRRVCALVQLSSEISFNGLPVKLQ